MLENIIDAARWEAKRIVVREIRTGTPQAVNVRDLVEAAKFGRIKTLQTSLRRSIERMRADETDAKFDERADRFISGQDDRAAELEMMVHSING
jgi:hypothetical protein